MKTTESRSIREDIDQAIARCDVAAARRLLVEMSANHLDAASASFVVSRFERLRGSLSLAKCRVTILRSFTVEPIVPLLRARAFAGGIDLDVRLGDFDLYFQEVIDSNSGLYQFAPDVAIFAVQTRDVAPDLWEGFADLDAAGVESAVTRVVDRFNQLIQTFRSRSKAHLIVHTLQVPSFPAAGILDRQIEQSQSAAIERVNGGILAACRQHTSVYALDYNALLMRHGEQAWDDPRRWLTVRLPISANAMIHLAEEWLRFLHPITGRTCKAIVVDLDNTLWGGVIGEDGFDGIKLDEGYPGAAYRSLQRALLDLYRRGIILAICSKNNPPEAMEVLQNHRGMVLKMEHFAAVQINWNDKAANLRAIAQELNIGIDSLAFLDDNPAERTWVRSQLPEVTVIDLPDDPVQFADTIRRQPVFERLSLSDEDRERGRMYVEQRMRSELQQSAGTLEDFYRSLEMKIEVATVTPATLARTAQLTQKTNQFNLTTRRYSEQQIKEMSESKEWRVYTLRVADRFGDNGLVGVAITQRNGEVCEIDSLLLSCRVIGRTVETAFLATIADDARSRGARKLAGWFIPTKKNAPAREFYRQHQFTLAAEQDGRSHWELPLDANSLSCPPWIQRTVSLT
jgi:FkbH-like protein